MLFTTLHAYYANGFSLSFFLFLILRSSRSAPEDGAQRREVCRNEEIVCQQKNRSGYPSRARGSEGRRLHIRTHVRTYNAWTNVASARCRERLNLGRSPCARLGNDATRPRARDASTHGNPLPLSRNARSRSRGSVPQTLGRPFSAARILRISNETYIYRCNFAEEKERATTFFQRASRGDLDVFANSS